MAQVGTDGEGVDLRKLVTLSLDYTKSAARDETRNSTNALCQGEGAFAQYRPKETLLLRFGLAAVNIRRISGRSHVRIPAPVQTGLVYR